MLCDKCWKIVALLECGTPSDDNANSNITLLKIYILGISKQLNLNSCCKYNETHFHSFVLSEI